MTAGKEQRTEIQNLGEFGIIERIKSNFELKQSSTKVGIGDDAAVIGDGDKLTLVSTDMLVEGVHFDLSYCPLQHLGYKAVAVNVSDIAAMNGVPEQITVSLALSNRFSVEAIDQLYEGIGFACKQYNIDLIGGDTTSSRSGLIISVTAIGTTGRNQLALRNKANLNDIVCVTGDLGAAYLGLQILEREKRIFKENQEIQPQLDQYDYIVRRQLKAEARMDVIYELRAMDLVPTSMIDISDGLASELFHLCKASNTGVRIFEDKIPLDEQTTKTALEFNISPVTCALNGGEDYELLFTIKQEDFDKIKNHPDIHTIGYIDTVENGKNLITPSEAIIPLKAQGWQHF